MAKDKGFQGAVLGIGAIVVLFGIAANSKKQAPPPASAQKQAIDPTADDWRWEARAKAEIAKLLKDPESAVFSDVKVSHRVGATVVCGYVNSRNSFGGMSGRQMFMSGSITALEENLPAGDMARVWAKMC